jgi:acetylornithine deacetylase
MQMTISEDLTSDRSLEARAISHLQRLVAFDTTSRVSNLELIAYVEAELGRLGVPVRRIANAEGTKANLLATLGPQAEGGVVLSGHTDVVPVDGQAWTGNPFELTRRGDRLYGRGTCDMKGFLALMLAAAPTLAAAPLARPVHLAFSYDEEIGCLGAPAMIEALAAGLPRPALVVVGEPTSMQVVSGHKGISVYRVRVTGHEAHSSLTHLGVSAIMEALKLAGDLRAIASKLEQAADRGSPFEPPHATLTIGQINGGTAANILARECAFLFDLRCPPGVIASEVLQPFHAAAAELDAALKARFAECAVTVEQLANAPPLNVQPADPAEAFARRLAGDNGPVRVVSYAAEAGQFQEAGFPTVICGPGSIEQAHQPDEYIDLSQLKRGALFMSRLVDELAAG